MPVVEVTDPDDPRLLAYTRLTDMQLRMVAEPAEGIFMAEGEKVIRRALAAGLQISSALMAPKWWPGLAAVIPEGTPVLIAPPPLLADITGYRVHRGALAVFVRPAPPPVATVLKTAATALLPPIVSRNLRPESRYRLSGEMLPARPHGARTRQNQNR